MASHPKLRKQLLGGAALVAVATAAQAMGVGTSTCVLGGIAAGPIGMAVGALLGFAGSFAGGWFSNRHHDRYKTLEYELNDPTDVLRNHFLRRIVCQAIRLGIRHGTSGSVKDPETVNALGELEEKAIALFERDSNVADKLDLAEPQIERFFTGRWEDFDRVPTPDGDAWRMFLEEAAGSSPTNWMRLAVGIAADTLGSTFSRFLFDNAKLASENDRPAYAALELMLIRSLAGSLADQKQQLAGIDTSVRESAASLAEIRSELVSLRESLTLLPSHLKTRIVLPDLAPFDDLRNSVIRTQLAVPGAVQGLDARLDAIESLLRATYEGVAEIRDVQRGDRKLLARLPLVAESIRDNANRDWIIRQMLSTGAAGCVAVAEHRGKRTVFKVSLIEDFARSYAREVEAATTLQGLDLPDARFCRIFDSRLPTRNRGNDAEREPIVLPPYWIQLEHFPSGNLETWWRSQAMGSGEREATAARIVAEIAATVGIAHRCGVLHRDLKPTNILMREDASGSVVPFVADFGIASFTDPERSAALQEHASGKTLQTKAIDAAAHQGTLLYMAPELYERTSDHRPPALPSMETDVYALGMILYWLLTGRQERPSRELVQAHVHDRALAYVIRRATHRDSDRRYRSAAAFQAELLGRTAVIPRLPELEDALLSDADRLALEKERLQASEQQREVAEKERARAEEQTARALFLVRRLRWSAIGLVLLSALALIGFFLSVRRAEGERLAKLEAESNAYFSSVVGAEAAIQKGEWNKARMFLARAPASLQKWEWRYFSAQCDLSLAVLRGHEGSLYSATFNASGSRVVTASWDRTARLWDSATGRETAVLRGHEGIVISAVFSPSDSRVVTASWDRTARVWDTATGNELTVLRGHESMVTSAVFSPSDSRVVTASRDRTARVWDTTTGNELAVLRGHEGSVTFAVFSPGGLRVVTASEDKTARIWDAATGDEVAVLGGHENIVTSAEFSPNGLRVVTASWDQTARIWDVATGNEVAVLRGHEFIANSAAFNPDGSRVATASSDKTARVWDATTGIQVAVLRGHEDSVNSARFSPDGSRVVTASSDGTARMWDAATGIEVAVLRGHEDSVNSARFNPDGSRVVTASWDGTVRVWDAATAPEVAVLRGHESMVKSADFSPDGSRVIVALEDGTARIWDTATGNEVAVLRGHERTVHSAEFSPDGLRVITASWDRTARIWDTATGNETAVLRGHEDIVTSAEFSPDGSRVATASLDGTARVWDTAAGYEIAVLRGHESFFAPSAAFSPDGSRIVTRWSDQTARAWEAATGIEVAVLRGHEGSVNSVEFGPGSSRVITASGDGTARIWDVATGIEVAVLRGHEGSVNSARFNLDGSRVVTASDDKTARIWDAATGSEVAVLRGHGSPVNFAKYNPDGSRVVTAAWDQTARVWDTATGSEVAVLRGHEGSVHSAAFSPDGSRVVTLSLDGTARVWAGVPWRERFKELVARGLRK